MGNRYVVLNSSLKSKQIYDIESSTGFLDSLTSSAAEKKIRVVNQVWNNWTRRIQRKNVEKKMGAILKGKV